MKREVIAGGGVVVRDGEAGAEVLIVHKRQPAEWRLPKGKVRAGESLEQAALREVHEEAGVEAEILGRVGIEEHWFEDPRQGRQLKRTTFFLMRPISDNARPLDERFDAAVWVSPERAIRTLTFDNEKEIVERALREWRRVHGQQMA